MSVILFLASKADQEFAETIEKTLSELGVASESMTASAHKVPEKVVQMVDDINKRKEPTVVIAVVGMSNGLGGVLAANCVHPVINCPPHKDLDEYTIDIHSSLRMPSDVPALTVLHPKNAALAAAKILGGSDPNIRKKVEERIKKVKSGY
ncbi:AIR carboxylase family protein [Candidatus Peregrinibacteria bacterium]|nr:AIR carboxylase family protein [Candidatus Peregrinibacteria bacterium]